MKLSRKHKMKAIRINILNALTIKLLYLMYYFRKRALRIKNISQPDPVILNGNPVVIYLELEGCYKIIVNGSTVLPGNTRQICLKPEAASIQLKLTLFGCREFIERNRVLKVWMLAKNIDFSSSLRCNPFRLILLKPPIKETMVRRFRTYKKHQLRIPEIQSLRLGQLSSNFFSFTRFKTNLPIHESETINLNQL